MKYKTNRAYPRKVWIYKEADFDKLNNLFQRDWNSLITDAPNIDTATENFVICKLMCAWKTCYYPS